MADDGRAVGVGDDAVVPLDDVTVDLGDHEGHVVVQAERMAVVDAHAAALDGLGQERLGNVVACGTQHDVHALEGVGLGQPHGHVLATETHGLAHGALARQRDELGHGEIALLEAGEHLGAHDARRAENRYDLLAHWTSFAVMSTISLATNAW